MALLEVNFNPTKRDLRQFAYIWLAFFGLFAAFLFWRAGGWSFGAKFFAALLPLGLIGALYPPFMRPIFVIWMYLAFPIGWTLSHVMMLVIFYLVVTPIGLMLRLTGYDPMKLRFDRIAKTYWQARETNLAPARYFQQF